MKSLYKISLVTLFTLFSNNVAFGSTCSSISRSNAAANSILTSTQYNNDLNTVYNASNAFDGGCVTVGTLEYDALNTTQFAAVLNGVKEGCKVTVSDTNTLSVDKCMIAVNGLFVRTTVATTVTWGCTSCSAEAASTQYYLYVKTGSTGSTLNLLISTVAPTGDGYDASSNRVIGRFFNNSSSNIVYAEQYVNGTYVTPRSVVRLNTANGFGSSNTKIRRFTTAVKNEGTDITYADSATLGGKFTINVDGIYCISYTDAFGGNADMGLSLNSAQGTTSLSSITTADRLTGTSFISASQSFNTVSWSGPLSANDFIWAHDDGTAGGTAALATITVSKCGP